MKNKLQLNSLHWRICLIALLLLQSLSTTVNAQNATYTCEPFNANVPGYPTWTAGANFKTPTVDWTESRVLGSGSAQNNWQWVNAGANPVAANQNIAGFPSGTGFIRYINRTVAYPALSGASNGDAALIATRSLDWSGHTVYNALTDTFGISVWRDNTAGCAAVLDYIEVYVNTTPSLAGATLALTTGGANKIHRSSTQTPMGAVAAAWNRYQFVIPNEARFGSAIGGTSSAYIIIAGYSHGGNNIFVDNINMPQWPTLMQVTAANVTVAQTVDVGSNTSDNLILGMQITTKGSLNPRRLDGILFNTVGSTSFFTDVVQPNGAKCWFTGGGSAFATTSGAVSVPKVNPSSPTYNNATLFFGWLDGVSGCPTALTPTTVLFYPGNENFIWLAYDIAPGAISGHNVAANFEQLFSGWSSPGVAGCFNDTVITSAGIQTPTSYANFTPSPSISAVCPISNMAYNIPTYSGGTSAPGGGYYNNDFISAVQIFGDNSTSIHNYLHDNLCASCVAVGGPYCQRHACHPTDYTIFPPSFPGTYMNRGPLQVTQGKGVRNGTAPYVLKTECGTWYSANTIGVFIDWNKDGDFDDTYNGTGGMIYENYGSKQQTQCLNMGLPKAAWGANTSWNISVPKTTDVVTDQNNALQPPNNSTGPIITGNVRMRIREVYAAPGSAAGVIGVHPTQSGFTWGEVEDYTVQVLPDCPSPGSNVCKWVGATNDWNDPINWCPAIPTKNDIAFIAPGPANMPVILDNTVAECRTLSIEPGARLGIDATTNSSLKVYDDVEIGRGATGGTGSSIAVTGDSSQTITIPGKSSIPPAGLALTTVTPFRTSAQTKTQIAYTASELLTTYGWKAGDIIDQISIEVNSITGGAGPSTFQNLRIMAYLTTTAITYPFPAPANTKIAVMPGDANVVAGWPKTIFPQQSVVLNMPMGSNGTQAGGNYYTFNLTPNTLIWDGQSNLVLSFENWTQSGLAPAKSYVLYDEPNSAFTVLALNYATVTAGAINGQNLSGAGVYNSPAVIAAGITATVSNQRPRLDFKLRRPYNQFNITVGGDWINNNRNIRTTAYSNTPVYNIIGDSGFIAGKAKVIFDPTGRNTVSSPGLAVANAAYYTGTPGQLLTADLDQDITSACTGGGNSTVFGTLEINKVSAINKAVRQNSTFNPYLNGHYADTLILTSGELKLNRKTFTLQTNSANALQRTNGWIRSEDNVGGTAGTIESKFAWKIGSGTTGTYSVPFKNTTTGTSVFKLKFAKNVAADSIGVLTVGTYSTATNNTPYTFPSLPAGDPLHVISMLTNPSPVLDATPWTVDRFWYIDRTTAGAITGTLSFEYDNTVEGTLTSAYVAGEMKAQRYEVSPSDTGWNAPFPGQSDAIVAGNVRVVNHPASYIDPTYNIWAVVHTNALQPPLGGIGCVAATPTISANGPLTFCNGSVTLTSSAANTYSWSTGATTQSITVSTSGSYIVTITDGSGCTGVSVPTVVNAGIAAAVITAAGSTTICQNDSVLLSSSAATTYTWSTGATTQSIYAKTAATYYVVVANASGCTALSNSIVVTVNSLPNATITVGGPTTFCFGDSVSLTSSTGVSYLWSTGATTKKIYAFNTGTYTVTVTKSNGCSKSSAPVSVTASPSTPPTITASGPTTFCVGGSVTLTSSIASSYTWSTGATTQSINVATSGTYFVIAGNASSCSAQSASVSVTVNQATVPTISATGPLTFCPGQNVILTCSPANSYLWSTGVTTQSIAVSTAGSYQVSIIDGSGCTASSAPAVVIVNCPKPVGLTTTNITSTSAKTNWGTVSCATGYRMQYRVNGTTTWTTKSGTTTYKNLIGLLSSTQYDWRVATKCPDGSYSAYTAIQQFTTLVIKEGNALSVNEPGLNLYPNPNEGSFTLDYNSLENSDGLLKILNTLGESVFEKNVSINAGNNILQIDVRNLSTGIYYVFLKASENTLQAKLVITNR